MAGIFYVNIPIGLLAALLSYSYLKPTKPSVNDRSIDWLGIALLAVGIGSLQIILERGETDDWFSANYIVALSVIATLCLSILVWWELHIKYPVINLRVLKSTTLSLSAVMTFILGFGLFSAVFVFPLYAQRIIGYTAFQTGIMLLPGTLMAAMISPFLGKMLQSGLRPQYLIILGFAFSAIFGYLMSRSNLETGSSYFFVPLLFRGVGAALLIVPLTALAVSELKPAEIPQGAALNNMMRQMGGSFGIALINTYITNRAAANRTALIPNITASDHATYQRTQSLIQNFMAHGSNYINAAKQAMGALETIVVRQTYLMSYMNAFLLLGILNACCIPLVIITIKKRAAGKKVIKITISDH